MRARFLKVEGFGPFLEDYEIDFDKVGANGCFALSGPTGSGKSMLIDAIVFALYGRPAREGASDVRIRSSKATAENTTKVAFAFTVNGTDYAIWRTPRQERAKKRGGGTTEAPAKVSLYRLQPGALEAGRLEAGDILGTKAADVAIAIERIVGLSCNQFAQTVVLPQGQFDRFVSASNDERAQLLRQLFGTQNWEQFARNLKEEADEAKEGVSRAREGFSREISNLLVALDISEDADLPSLDTAGGAAACADSLAGLGTLCAEARAQATSLAAEAESIRREADRIAGLNRLHEDYAKARTVFEEAERACLAASVPTSGQSIADREKEESRLASAIGKLGETLRQEELLAAKEKEYGEKAQEKERTEAEACQIAKEIETIPARIGQAEAELQDARNAASGLDKAETRLMQARETLSALKELDAARKESERKGADAARAREARLAATAAYKEVFERWVASTAARLAKELEDTPNAQCPVCGATEHPKLAAEGANHASDEERKQAEARMKAAENSARKADEAKAAAAERAQTLAGKLEGRDEASTRAEATDADRAVHEAKKAQTVAARLEAKLDSLRKAKDELADRLSASEKAKSRADAALEELGKAIAQLKDTIADELDGFGSIAERLARIESDLKAYKEGTQALRNLEHGRQQADKAREDRDRALAATEYASMTAAELAALACATANEARQAEDRHAAAQDRAGQAERILARVANAYGEWNKAETEAEPVLRLSDLAQGGKTNNANLRLATFVLLQRFEQVLAVANERIAVISNGRYRLSRSEETRGNKKAGLDVSLVDTYVDTGMANRERPISTASGGETFYISLSLALALADVVQAENGGIRLDTLLIDEGFGRLSSDYLEDVIDELDRLADTRLVGAISHVEALKEHFPNRIQVTPNGDGTSSITTVCL